MKTVPLVSVILATKNREGNIGNCLQSIEEQTYPASKIEIIVVDNYSHDNTVKIARSFTEKIYIRGPKRAAQVNFGVKEAKGDYILYPDVDMILSKGVIEECVEKCENENCIALYIPEKIIGNGFWIKIRDFERGFYGGTCCEAVRFSRRDKFLEVNGLDEENLDFGLDDWDFDRRIREMGNVGTIKSTLFHDEGKFNLGDYLRKKKYYVETINKYERKWGKADALVRKQLGARYRLFGVFIENGRWKRLIRHPLLAISMYLLRFMVGVVYVTSKKSVDTKRQDEI